MYFQTMEANRMLKYLKFKHEKSITILIINDDRN